MKDSFTYTAHLLPIWKPKFAIKGLKGIEAYEKMYIILRMYLQNLVTIESSLLRVQL